MPKTINLLESPSMRVKCNLPDNSLAKCEATTSNGAKCYNCTCHIGPGDVRILDVGCRMILKLQILMVSGNFIDFNDLTRVSHLPIDRVHGGVCNPDDDFVFRGIRRRAFSNFRFGLGGGNPSRFVLKSRHLWRLWVLPAGALMGDESFSGYNRGCNLFV